MARTAGSLNKFNRTVQQRCDESGCDPVQALCELMKDPDYRFDAAKVLMEYIYPKKKSIEFDIKDLPDQAFDQEIERRVHLKILKGEIKASDVS